MAKPVTKPAEALSLTQVMQDINKTYGKGTIIFGKDAKNQVVQRVKWGIFELDYEIGGGVPCRRVIHLQGPFSSGKTSLALKLVAAVQRKLQKNKVAYLEVEGTLDVDWARRHGVDIESLVLTPDIPSMQAALNIAEELSATGEFGMVVIDSIGAMTPQEEIDAPVDDWSQGLKARILNKFMRKIVPAMHKKAKDGTENEVIVLLLNQEYDTMDKYHPVSAPGGRGKDYTSSVMIQLYGGDWIIDGNQKTDGVKVGKIMKFRVLKNKTYPRARDGEFDFYFANHSNGFKAGQIDNLKCVILKSIDTGVIKQSSGWYYYDGKQYQGKDALVEALKEHPERLKAIRAELFENLKKNPFETIHTRKFVFKIKKKPKMTFKIKKKVV